MKLEAYFALNTFNDFPNFGFAKSALVLGTDLSANR